MTKTPVPKLPPPTAGKTTVPARTITPVPKPKALPPLTPQQQATRAVNQSLAPVYAQQNTSASRQNNAITAFTQAIISQLQGMPAQVQGDYNQAIQGQSQLAQNAADALRNANPNQQDQTLLNAIGAPQAQHDALTSQNANVFNGGAAVGQYTNGVLPMDSLRSQGLAATELARLQPGFQGLRGQQALGAALAQQSDARGKIDAMRPGLVQSYTNSLNAAQQKQQYLDLVNKKFGYTVTSGNKRIDQTQQRLNQQQTQFVQKYNQQATKFNQTQANPNASLSGKVGYLVDSTGAPIIRNGKLVVLPGNRVVNGRVVKQGSKAKTSRLTASQVQRNKGDAYSIATNGKSGFFDRKLKDPNDSTKPLWHPPLTPFGAWQEMLKHGIPETMAVQALNRVYGTNFNAANPLP